MAVILTPLTSDLATGNVSCVELDVVSPEDTEYLGCPILNKVRTVSLTPGVCSTILWPIRDRSGNAVDLTTCLDSSLSSSSESSAAATGSQVIARFKDIFSVSPTVHQIIGESPEPSTGQVRITLDDTLLDSPGIYHMEIGITDVDGLLQFTDKGLVSIERGLFESALSLSGPITLGEIRTELQDHQVQNDLLDDMQFKDSDLIHAMIQPVRYWNEMPPPLQGMNAGNFPFHYWWLQATTAHLLKMAAHWYRRNKLQASHGGIKVDDKNKDQEYYAIARDIEKQWKEFVILKKASINAGLAMGSVNSVYGYGFFGR